MKIEELLGDLLSADSPEIRHESPPVRQPETRTGKGDSPHSPLSPASAVQFVAGHWTVSLEHPRQVERTQGGELLELVVCQTAAEAYRLLSSITGKAWYPSCAECTHLRKPGLSAGYCSANRLDLQPAYGVSHVLRRLPPDRGRTCIKWEPQR